MPPRLYGPYAASTIAEKRIFGRRFIQIEESRENLCRYNRTLDDLTWWTRDNLAVAPDQAAQILSPDVNAYGWEVQENTSNSTHGLQGGITFDGASEYCFSVWAYTDDDANRSNYMGLDFGDGGFLDNTFTTWDLTTATLINEGSDVTGSGIEDWGSGWYRLWITAVSDNAAALSTCQIHLTNAAGDATYTGASKTAVWFHPQIEKGAYPSSPITTTSSNVTRDKDMFEWQEVDVPSALRGAFKFQFIPFWASDETAINSYLFDFEDSGTSPRVYLFYRQSSDRFRIHIDGTTYDSEAITFNSRQVITVTINPNVGTFTIGGCTSGNGVVTAEPWETLAGNVYWGQIKNETLQCNGLISEPY
jgi:hypothetical protein